MLTVSNMKIKVWKKQSAGGREYFTTSLGSRDRNKTWHNLYPFVRFADRDNPAEGDIVVDDAILDWVVDENKMPTFSLYIKEYHAAGTEKGNNVSSVNDDDLPF